MDTQEKIQRICEILQELGQPGSAQQLAYIFSVCPSTVARYLAGEIQPRPHMQGSIDFLHNILTETVNGNQQARRIVDAVLGQRGLVHMGLGGAVVMLGMSWLVSDESSGKPKAEPTQSPGSTQSASKPCDSSAERPTTRKATRPESASRKRASARKPSKNG